VLLAYARINLYGTNAACHYVTIDNNQLGNLLFLPCLRKIIQDANTCMSKIEIFFIIRMPDCVTFSNNNSLLCWYSHNVEKISTLTWAILKIKRTRAVFKRRSHRIAMYRVRYKAIKDRSANKSPAQREGGRLIRPFVAIIARCVNTRERESWAW